MSADVCSRTLNVSSNGANAGTWMCRPGAVTGTCLCRSFSLPGGMAYALRSERSVLATSRFESGGRDQLHDAGVAEKVNATLKR